MGLRDFATVLCHRYHHRASNPYASERLFKGFVFWTASADTLGRTTFGHLVALADDISTVQIDDEVIACRVVISLSRFRFPNRLARLSLSFFVTFRIFRSTIPIIFGHIDVIRTAILIPIPYSHSEEVSAHRCVVNISYAFRQYTRRWLGDQTDRSPKSPSPGTMNESLSRPSSTQAVICNTVQYNQKRFTGDIPRK